MRLGYTSTTAASSPVLLVLLLRWQQWLAAQYVKMAYYLVNDFRQLTIDRLVSLIPIHHK